MMESHSTNDKPSKRLRLFFVIPFAVVALVIFFLAPNVPVTDDYDAILKYLNYPWPERLSHIFDFHSLYGFQIEHRLATTRIFAELVCQLTGQLNFRTVMWIGCLCWFCFVAIFARIFSRLGKTGYLCAVISAWFLIGFYDDENLFWPMASIQNHFVLLYALAACLAFSRRADIRWFILSIVLAIAATFTSGQGLLVFPALAFVALYDFLCGQDRRFTIKRISYAVTFAIIATITIIVYLHGIQRNSDPSLVFSTDPIQRIANSLLFIVYFFGNFAPFTWLPFSYPCFLAGIIVIAWGLVVCWYMIKNKQGGGDIRIYRILRREYSCRISHTSHMLCCSFNGAVSHHFNFNRYFPIVSYL